MKVALQCNFFKFFSLEEQERLLTTKGSYFKLILHKLLFRDVFQETHDEISKEISKIKFKDKSIYFIQHICEEYLVFWFSQIELISEFAKRKTVMKVDSELYDLLIHRLLNYDNLAFIKEIWKDTANPQSGIVSKPSTHEKPNASNNRDSQKQLCNQ